MNFLTKIKSANEYNYIVDSLYKEVIDEETGETSLEPITDIDGDTALLITDGSSWQLTDGVWEQIEQNLDYQINQSLYPFILSVCESIHNCFIKKCMSRFYENAILAYTDIQKKDKVEITNLNEEPIVQDEDFVIIGNCVSNYLTQVTAITNDSIEVKNDGVNIRVTGKEENIKVCFVSFPMSFLMTVLDMLSYDFFHREAKELRQERLGNYTYTNFEPIQYYGEGSYPKYLEDSLKYWQKVFL